MQLVLLNGQTLKSSNAKKHNLQPAKNSKAKLLEFIFYINL